MADCRALPRAASICSDGIPMCDLGTGTCVPPASQSFLVKLDSAGAFRRQRSSGVGALDGCGAVIYVTQCEQCAANSGPGVTVQRLAP